MKIYDDYELNKIANEVRDEIDEIGQAMSSMMGVKTNLDKNLASQIITKVHSTPTQYAREILTRNGRKLIQMKNRFGYNDDAYQQISEGFAMTIIGILRIQINFAEMMTKANDFKSNLNSPDVQNIKQNLTESASILNELNQFYFSQNVRFQYINLQETVKVLEKKFNPSTGCYIATYVYGGYDATEVIKLRLFRDRFLEKNALGRKFISLYYKNSPTLIKKFGNNKLFKTSTKAILNLFVKALKH